MRWHEVSLDDKTDANESHNKSCDEALRMMNEHRYDDETASSTEEGDTVDDLDDTMAILARIRDLHPKPGTNDSKFKS